MVTDELVQRRLASILIEALEDTPVVLIHGARQCGKTTLARQVGGEQGYHYLNFDDDTQRAAAQADPTGFVAGLPDRTILDEIQHLPGLFSAIKASVDHNRTPGRFMLTGSANVLLLPKLADSLAGRMAILNLRPLAQCELSGGPADIPGQLFDTGFTDALPHGQYARLGEALAEILVHGGYPAVLARNSERRRQKWYSDYANSLIQRDIRQLSRIQNLDILPRLLTLAAGQTARLFQVSELAAPFQLSRPTIREYLTLLQHIFLLEELPPWHNNHLKRVIKTPKLHLADTGLAAALLAVNSRSLWQNRGLLGQLLETFVYQELRKQGDWYDYPLSFSHYRDKDGVEVDIVMEQGERVAGVEVKAAATVTQADFKGLRKLQQACGARFTRGAVFYDGDSLLSFGDDLFAVPLRLLVPENKRTTVN